MGDISGVILPWHTGYMLYRDLVYLDLQYYLRWRILKCDLPGKTMIPISYGCAIDHQSGGSVFMVSSNIISFLLATVQGI